MTGRLTTHVLDTARGKPGNGILIELHLVSPEGRDFIHASVTNADGRTEEPMLSGKTMLPGIYELTFHVGDYFSETLAFLDVVPVRFQITDTSQNYHVPLVCSPWSYSTYRGS